VNRHIPSRTLRRPLTALAAGLLAFGGSAALSALPAAASTPSAGKGVVDSGGNWAVTQAAGGYVVSLDLPAALPVKDDIPELFADGADLGPAAESPDGLTLKAITTDPAVATAKSISWRWSTGGNSTATGPTVLPSAGAQAKAQQKSLAKTPAKTPAGGTGKNDPTTIGTGTYTVADYNFGAQSIPLADIGGIRGELEGRVYLPNGNKPHPLVIFLHGRHSSCYDTTTLKGASGWPCPAGTAPILSYAGYDGAGEALAADGFTVVSISANAINANDNQLSPDDGAISRGQLVLDTLTMLKSANSGQKVSYHDAATGQDLSLDQALAAGRSTYPGGRLTAGQLKGTIDFSTIGLMGHSRGGEGVVTAGTLNEALPHPWNIKSVFALAPIDFTRDTLPDVETTTLLPYCDGDVSDQQGQHFYADSRDNTFADDVQRSDIWVMGTDHDFYNSSWTPPYPGASDDWSKADDPVCGTSDTALASGQNIRLTAAQEYQVGSAYIAGYFEATLGGQSQFQGMFDGSGAEPPSVSTFADVRTVAQQPTSLREDVATFKETSPQIKATGSLNATVCADKYGRTVPELLPDCTNPGSTLTSQQVPYWTPASFAPNVPLNPMTHLNWADTSGSLSVGIPAAQKNVSKYDEMTVDMSPDESVASGTDIKLSVSDTSGHTWSGLVSALNKWGVDRMPASTSTNLGKIVLQQVHVPTATLEKAGLKLNSLSKVTFTPAVGADGTATGGEYLSDLDFDSTGLGKANPHQRPTVNVASTTVEEGSGAATDQVAVYLSKPNTSAVTAYLTVIGSTTGKVGLAMQKVTFPAGATCQAVDIPITGDTLAGTTPTTSYKIGVSDSTNAVLGNHDFGTVTVREDDGLTGTAVPAPPVGVQGNVCQEQQALSHPGGLTVGDSAPVPGESVKVTGSGYRVGESVSFTLGSASLGTTLADRSGKVSFQASIPGDQPYGKTVISGLGAGSGYSATADVKVTAAPHHGDH
jgi:trimeric autotransporter adhesin